MKREDQQDATIRCLLLTSVSTCSGHHYAHLQENKGPVTAFDVFWFCWMWLVAFNVQSTSKFCKLSTPTGINWRPLSNKIIFLYHMDVINVA